MLELQDSSDVMTDFRGCDFVGAGDRGPAGESFRESLFRCALGGFDAGPGRPEVSASAWELALKSHHLLVLDRRELGPLCVVLDVMDGRGSVAECRVRACLSGIGFVGPASYRLDVVRQVVPELGEDLGIMDAARCLRAAEVQHGGDFDRVVVLDPVTGRAVLVLRAAPQTEPSQAQVLLDLERSPLVYKFFADPVGGAWDPMGFAEFIAAAASERFLWIAPDAVQVPLSAPSCLFLGDFHVCDPEGPWVQSHHLARYYYHLDDQRSTVALTNETGVVVEGYDYSPYGAPVAYAPGPNGVVEWGGDDIVFANGAGPIGNRVLYTGRSWDDETGLHYYRTRYMSSDQGRFISGDTIGIWGDATGLGNGYTYVGNRPHDSVDSTGKYTETCSQVAGECTYHGYSNPECPMGAYKAEKDENGRVEFTDACDSDGQEIGPNGEDANDKPGKAEEILDSITPTVVCGTPVLALNAAALFLGGFLGVSLAIQGSVAGMGFKDQCVKDERWDRSHPNSFRR